MLNLFAQFPLNEYFSRSTDELHIQIEAQKLAYADLQRYVADPKFAKVPVDGMLSLGYARERAKLINSKKANCNVASGKPLEGTGETIYLSVVDRDGNIVSLIQSLFSDFGSAVVVDDYGFALHNRGGLFTLDAGHPNALAPGKRPFHTIIPGFMEKGNLHIGFGIMGGLNQAQAHAQFVSNVVDQEMNIQRALEAPRFRKMTQKGCEVSIENRAPQDALQGLAARGHVLKILGDYSDGVGGGQAVMYDSAAKTKYGASDPRKDGAAVPEAPPYFASQGARSAQ
jgi:gamma-glutamyltranspeptidase/glutathione hydrolase